jgi:hypothetical protein
MNTEQLKQAARPNIAQAIHDAAVSDGPLCSMEWEIAEAFLCSREWVFHEELHHRMFMLLVAEALS